MEPDLHRPDVDAADHWRERRDCWRDGRVSVLYPQSRVLTLIPLFVFWEIVELPAIFLLGFWFLMQLFSAGAIAVTANSHAGGVAFMAHVAGFIFGLVAVFIFKKRLQPDTRWV